MSLFLFSSVFVNSEKFLFIFSKYILYLKGNLYNSTTTVTILHKDKGKSNT